MYRKQFLQNLTSEDQKGPRDPICEIFGPLCFPCVTRYVSLLTYKNNTTNNS